MAPHSNLYHIQTTIPPLIAESCFEFCIAWGLTFLRPLSISVPGTSQLNQSYSMPTMHWPVKDGKVRSLCLRQDVSRDQLVTWGLQSFQGTVQLNCTLAHKGRLQATRYVIQDGMVPFRSTFLGPMCVYNGRDHGTASTLPCSHRAENWPKHASPTFWG
jgi:hypothetical protein